MEGLRVVLIGESPDGVRWVVRAGPETDGGFYTSISTIRYMAVVGDRVQILSKKVGGAPRDGVVTGVTGSLLRVRWSTGEQSTVVPSMGSLAVVGKRSGGGARRRQTTSASAAKGE
jgi:orotidine-5'-phosphate decarboxylase